MPPWQPIVFSILGPSGHSTIGGMHIPEVLPTPQVSILCLLAGIAGIGLPPIAWLVIVGALALSGVLAWRLRRALRDTDRMRSAFLSIEDLIFIYDREGRFTDFFQSPTMDSLLLQPSAFLGKHYREVLPTDLAEQTRIVMEGITRDLRPRQFDYELSLSGRVYKGNAKITPRFDKSGGLIGFTSVNREISARKKKEEDLDRSAREFRAVADNAATPMFIHDGHHIHYANQAMALLTKHRREDLLKLEPWKLLHPEDRAAVRDRGGRRLAGEQVQPDYDVRIQTLEGNTRWIHVCNSVIAFEGRKALLSTATDITDRRRREDALTRSEERFRLTLECASEGGWDWNVATGECFFSDRWIASLGYARADVQPSAEFWWAILHPEDVRSVELAIDDHLADRAELFECEHRLRAKSGDYRWYRCRGQVVERDEHGGPLRMLGLMTDTTEQVRANQKLAEAANELAKKSALLATIFDTTPDLIFVKDPEFRILICNSAFAEAMGRAPEELYGHTDVENGCDPLLVRGDPARGIRGYEEDDRDVLAGRTVHNRPDPANINGEIRYYDTHKHPLRNVDGNIFGVLGMSRDITERKAAEKALRESLDQLATQSALLQAVFDTTPDLIFVKDPESRTVLCNKAFAAAVGKIPEEMYGHTDVENGWDPVMVKGDPTRGIRGYEDDDRDVLGGQTVRNRTDPVDVNGERRIFDTHKVPLRDEEGRIFGILGMSHDITNRRRVEEALREKDKQLGDVGDTLPLGAIYRLIHASDGRRYFDYMSDGFERLFSLPVEMMAKNATALYAMVHPDDIDAAIEAERRSADIMEAFKHECRFIMPDGNTRWFWWHSMPKRFPHGGVAWSGIVLDVTDRKLIEQELVAAHDELELRVKVRTAELAEANKKLFREMQERETVQGEAREHQNEAAHLARVSTIGQMAVEIAHEVNQPLTAIANFANGCLRRLPRDAVSPGFRTALESIVEQCGHARKIVRRIQAFARKGVRRRVEFEIAQVIRDALALIAEDAKRHGIQISLNLHTPGDQAYGVSLEIEQVMVNLILNAIEAMTENPEGQRSLVIGQRREGNRLLISVQDTGRGIREDLRGSVFDSFVTTKEEGLGLGLAISKTIVEDHGGSIWIDTVDNAAGATFCFTLPKSGEKRNG